MADVALVGFLACVDSHVPFQFERVRRGVSAVGALKRSRYGQQPIIWFTFAKINIVFVPSKTEGKHRALFQCSSRIDREESIISQQEKVR